MKRGFLLEEIHGTFSDQKPEYRLATGHGGVVCNSPVGLIRGRDRENSEAAAISAIEEFRGYGGFLVCESCPDGIARRIVAALNFCEGLSDEFLETHRFTRFLPATQSDHASEVVKL
jgi:hypothetical protein